MRDDVERDAAGLADDLCGKGASRGRRCRRC